jgi:hypothetical protein
MSALDTVLQFVDAINAHEVDRLCALIYADNEPARKIMDAN